MVGSIYKNISSLVTLVDTLFQGISHRIYFSASNRLSLLLTKNDFISLMLLVCRKLEECSLEKTDNCYINVLLLLPKEQYFHISPSTKAKFKGEKDMYRKSNSLGPQHSSIFHKTYRPLFSITAHIG